MKCEIKLNDPNGNGVYYVGQTIAGTVEMNLTRISTIKSIDIHIQGKPYCKFHEEINLPKTLPDSNTNQASMRYIGRDRFLSYKNYLLQKSQNSTENVLPPGPHIYQFSCQLSNQVPPSITTELGFIRYRIVVTIERSWRAKKRYSVKLNVLIPLNLNFDPIARQPNCVEKSFKLFGNKIPLVLRIRTPRTGYAIGEVLPISVEVDSLNNIKIKYFIFVLRQRILYQSTIPWPNSHSTIQNVVEYVSGNLSKLKVIKFDHHITIPYLTVTNKMSRIIGVSYDLEIVMVPKGWHKKQKMEVPIIIGNIPINELAY